MGRPPRKRKVVVGSAGGVFRPPAGRRTAERLKLPLDGLEAIRLVDLQGLYQEEAARLMGVSRPTFARVLARARGAVADALVNGKAVVIGGGPVETRSRADRPCPVHGGPHRTGRTCHCKSRPGLEGSIDRGRIKT